MTYHANAGAEGVWWEIAPEFPLHDTGIPVGAGDTTKIARLSKGMGRCREEYIPPNNPDL